MVTELEMKGALGPVCEGHSVSFEGEGELWTVFKNVIYLYLKHLGNTSII